MTYDRHEPLNPWTETVHLLWPPELTFYEVRLTILRTLADQKLLIAYRATEQEEVGALVGDGEDELVVTPSSLSLTVSSVHRDRRSVYAALVAVLSNVRPSVAEMMFQFQFVEPIETERSSTDMASVATRNLLSDLGTNVGGTDFALLMDGYFGSPYQVEFGIVGDNEIPDRISRAVGRMRPDKEGPRPKAWEEREVPSVAFFADLKWLDWPIPNGGVTSEGVLQAWDECIHISSDLVHKLVQSAIPEGGE